MRAHSRSLPQRGLRRAASALAPVTSLTTRRRLTTSPLPSAGVPGPTSSTTSSTPSQLSARPASHEQQHNSSFGHGQRRSTGLPSAATQPRDPHGHRQQAFGPTDASMARVSRSAFASPSPFITPELLGIPTSEISHWVQGQHADSSSTWAALRHALSPSSGATQPVRPGGSAAPGQQTLRDVASAVQEGDDALLPTPRRAASRALAAVAWGAMMLGQEGADSGRPKCGGSGTAAPAAELPSAASPPPEAAAEHSRLRGLASAHRCPQPRISADENGVRHEGAQGRHLYAPRFRARVWRTVYCAWQGCRDRVLASCAGVPGSRLPAPVRGLQPKPYCSARLTTAHLTHPSSTPAPVTGGPWPPLHHLPGPAVSVPKRPRPASPLRHGAGSRPASGACLSALPAALPLAQVAASPLGAGAGAVQLGCARGAAWAIQRCARQRRPQRHKSGRPGRQQLLPPGVRRQPCAGLSTLASPWTDADGFGTPAWAGAWAFGRSRRTCGPGFQQKHDVFRVVGHRRACHNDSSNDEVSNNSNSSTVQRRLVRTCGPKSGVHADQQHGVRGQQPCAR